MWSAVSWHGKRIAKDDLKTLHTSPVLSLSRTKMLVLLNVLVVLSVSRRQVSAGFSFPPLDLTRCPPAAAEAITPPRPATSSHVTQHQGWQPPWPQSGHHEQIDLYVSLIVESCWIFSAAGQFIAHIQHWWWEVLIYQPQLASIHALNSGENVISYL